MCFTYEIVFKFIPKISTYEIIRTLSIYTFSETLADKILPLGKIFTIKQQNLSPSPKCIAILVEGRVNLSSGEHLMTSGR